MYDELTQHLPHLVQLKFMSVEFFDPRIRGALQQAFDLPFVLSANDVGYF